MRPLEKRVPPTGATFAVRQPSAPMPLRRRLVLIIGGAFLLVLATGGVYWALHAPFFSVTRIETGSYRFTAPAELDSVLGTFLGKNMLALREDEVARSMASLVWVRGLNIQRRFPRTLAVDFREWRPLAVVGQDEASTAGAAPLVLADSGRLLPFPRELEIPALPTVLGLNTHQQEGAPDGPQGEPGSAGQQETDRLVELFQAMAAVGLETVAAVDFVVVRPEGYAIVLAGSQGRLQVGREDFRPRLERYLAARPHLEPGLDVDLRFADRVTVHHPPAGRPAAGGDG